ncbi:MAG: RluA family pseudouridine synthase [Bacteroidota bacterium]
MREKESYLVPLLQSPVRLSDYVKDIFKTLPSRKGMKKAIRKGLVKVNGEVASTALFIHGGEEIVLYESEIEAKKPILELKIKVLYEDDHLAVVNKPAGILVSGNKFHTIENALPFNLQPSTQADAFLRPQAIHRLDYPTSGVLLIGKTHQATTALNQAFEQQKVAKTYYAVAIGEMELAGVIETPVDSRFAYSKYQVQQSVISKKYGFLNLVRLFPKTGRRHQLRKHLAAIEHPILGDKLYGKEGSISHGNGLYLHAFSIGFDHPVVGKELIFEQQLPKKFKKIFDLD